MVKVTDLMFSMDGGLKANLDSAVYNINKDWDFMFIVSGDGMVRVGKSVFAQQMAYYVAYNLGRPFSVDNVVFSGEDLIKTAHALPKNSCIIYDEARAELNTIRAMYKFSSNLIDFFAECGLYNHFFVLVLPEFFELTRTLALNRSHFLLNAYMMPEPTTDKTGNYVVDFKRGFFSMYGPSMKKKLYLKHKVDRIYDRKKCDGFGTFPNCWVLDKSKYEAKKRAFVRRNREETSGITERVAIAKKLYLHPKMKGVLTQEEIADICGTTKMSIWRRTRQTRKKPSKTLPMPGESNTKHPEMGVFA